MRRRTAIGLADPVVTNRFLLWSLWTAGISLVPLIALVARTGFLVIYGDGAAMEDVASGLAQQVMGLIRTSFLVIVPVTVAALSLSFFPPAAYLTHIRERAARRAATTSA
jgi:hypothetical protein